MNRCPFKGCRREVPPGRFCCSLHFARLTFDEQTRVFEAYADHRDGKIGGPRMRVVLQAILDAAQGRADG